MADSPQSNNSEFRYQQYRWELTADGLLAEFQYRIEPEFSFTHQVIFEGVTQSQLDTIPEAELNTLVFHLGLSEMASYWKLTAAHQIVIEAGSLSAGQIDWWHKLLIRGMGEYFYQNQIDFTADDFLNLQANEPQDSPTSTQRENSAEQAGPASFLKNAQLADMHLLIPVGGGKDSALTLELLRDLQVDSLVVNPTPAALTIAESALDRTPYVVRRVFDPLLFELNQRGFLNGHVPISSVIAFISLLSARIQGYAGVAIANERSSNEGTVWYKGHSINHQYSKSYEFERSLQDYVHEFLSPNTPFYFSLLRPLYELQIAQRFVKHGSAHFTSFRSCNRGQKSNSWCGECPKCLFAFTIIAPFLGLPETSKLFGKNLFADSALYPLALDLLGKTPAKPFECVGTIEETLCAFWLNVDALAGEPLPALLDQIQTEILASEPDLPARTAAIMLGWDEHNSVPAALLPLLTDT